MPVLHHAVMQSSLFIALLTGGFLKSHLSRQDIAAIVVLTSLIISGVSISPLLLMFQSATDMRRCGHEGAPI